MYGGKDEREKTEHGKFNFVIMSFPQVIDVAQDLLCNYVIMTSYLCLPLSNCASPVMAREVSAQH